MGETYIDSPQNFNHLIAEFIGLKLRSGISTAETIPEVKEYYSKREEPDSENKIRIEKDDWKPHKKYHQAFWALNKIKSMNYYVTLFMSAEKCSCEIWSVDRRRRICIFFNENAINVIYNAVVEFILYLQTEKNDKKEDETD
jgi:hypothetical protein